MALLRRMTCKDKALYNSLHPCQEEFSAERIKQEREREFEGEILPGGIGKARASEQERTRVGHNMTERKKEGQNERARAQQR